MANYGFAVFCILWIVLSLILLPVVEGQTDYSLMITDPAWTFVSILGLLASMTGIFAVLGIYHLNYEQGGLTLLIGIVLLVIGFALEMSGLSWDVFIWPVICSDSTHASFVRDGNFTNTIQFMCFFVSMVFFLLLGSVITAIGLLKTKRFGKLIPSLIIAGILFYLGGNFLSYYLSYIGLGLYSCAFILTGKKIMRTAKI